MKNSGNIDPWKRRALLISSYIEMRKLEDPTCVNIDKIRKLVYDLLNLSKNGCKKDRWAWFPGMVNFLIKKFWNVLENEKIKALYDEETNICSHLWELVFKYLEIERIDVNKKYYKFWVDIILLDFIIIYELYNFISRLMSIINKESITSNTETYVFFGDGYELMKNGFNLAADKLWILQREKINIESYYAISYLFCCFEKCWNSQIIYKSEFSPKDWQKIISLLEKEVEKIINEIRSKKTKWEIQTNTPYLLSS